MSYLDRYAGEPAALREALGNRLPARTVEAVHERVRAKLEREPVESFLIDFEDGFGVRSDAEEDEAAVTAAAEVAAGGATGSLPPALGIRHQIPLRSHGQTGATGRSISS